MLATVVFATITGNNEDVADIITEALEDADLTVQEVEISQADPADLLKSDITIIVPYTYDEGALPEEGLDYFDDLSELDLTGKVFGVAGSGDVFYGDDYGVAVDRFDERLASTGAIRGADKIKINLAPDKDDIKHLDQFANDIIAKATAL
ncbi:flavodoxin [Furfurilactobacillus siliginis]|uniref:Flavodoxin n=1 Tax=Furfurilactobacillus siliginis TaxID=348151 RepID=A0A0R2L0V0_9LACO|nr:flavodoxin [Furfurilactobacillus siliginis]KRN95330.1 flavodoxin [Furfurilactobacillus siliginis]GEK28272.1 flavodoxin [Furfurilactobacillus siliginis]